ncbi:MAG: HD domain-containing protein [Candidatus Nanoarchaeia archaeon]|jgi:putative nucleotidyltransferase with HDIG domain
MAGLEELVGQRISLLGDERKEKLDNYLERIRKAHTPTYLHCLRVGIKSQDAAKLFGCNTEEMLIAGLLHDIGKIYIPTEILDQHDEFSEEQYRKIESHPADGYCIVEKDFPFAAEILLRHHKYCKRSYPKKLPEPVNPRGFNLQAIAGYARILSGRRNKEAFRG